MKSLFDRITGHGRSMTTGPRIQWGLLAVGRIARAFAGGLVASQTGAALAIGSRSREKAEAFGREFRIPRCYGSYEELIADKDIQAIYVSTPHPMHAEWAIKAMEAGKHVLVEKPIGINLREARAIIEAARINKVFLMEAYMYRCHPQTVRLVELLREKVIGEVRVIQAAFSYNSGFDPASRIWNNALGGGGILDVGGYTTSIARLIAGTALGKHFAEPIELRGAGHLSSKTGVDEWAVATLKFEGDIVATIATGIAVDQENVVRIFGSEGTIFLSDPYLAGRTGAVSGRIIVNRNGKPREIAIESRVTSFAHEADVAGRAIAAGRQEADPMTWADTLGNIRTQDQWRAAIGLVYEAEKS